MFNIIFISNSDYLLYQVREEKVKSIHQLDAERLCRESDKLWKESHKIVLRLNRVLAQTAKPSEYMMNMTLGELAGTYSTPVLTTA